MIVVTTKAKVMPRLERGRDFLRFVLSVFILFHILTMVIVPNPTSYPARALGSLLFPYASTVGLNANWNFFSPDPAHTMYLKFTLYSPDENETPREMFFPEQKDEGEWDLGKRRNLYAMRFFMLDPKLIDAVLGPWLCVHQAPLSTAQIELVINSVATLDEAVLFGGKSMSQMSREFDAINREYRCSQMGDEVNL